MERYRIMIVADPTAALIPARRPRPGRRQPQLQAEDSGPAVEVLLRALRRVSRRGSGASAWASVAEDPISFLLESMSDPLLLRDQEGQTVYANPAAREMGRCHPKEFREHHFFLKETNPQLILSLYSRVRK